MPKPKHAMETPDWTGWSSLDLPSLSGCPWVPSPLCPLGLLMAVIPGAGRPLLLPGSVGYRPYYPVECFSYLGALRITVL